MARKGYIPTAQEIDRLAQAATAGNQSAIEELGNINNRLAKRANERMRDIERKGLEGTAAYNRAKYFIQEQEFGTGEYFSQSKKLDPDDLILNIQNASQYLRSQTSTAAGEIQRRKDIIDKLADRGHIELPDDSDDIEGFKKKFLEFLDSNAWDDIKKHMYAAGSGMRGPVWTMRSAAFAATRRYGANWI